MSLNKKSASSSSEADIASKSCDKNEKDIVSESNCNSKKEKLVIPGSHESISSFGVKAGKLLARQGDYFIKGDKLIEIDSGIIKPIKSDQFCSEIERFADISTINKKGELEFTILCDTKAKQIIASKSFKKEIPLLSLLSKSPVIIKKNNNLQIVDYHDRDSGILVIDGKVENISFDEAIERILSLIEDFNFTTEGDRSRAIADLITPGLVLGGVLDTRAPLSVLEANSSQTGKGYFLKIKTAIYNNIPAIVTQKKKGGVGSIEETFNSYLIQGSVFISFDNFRGEIDLPALESFLTEDIYPARAPYAGVMYIDPKKYLVSLTSNKGEMTEDLSNRSSIIKLLKQPEDYIYASYKEGDLLAHVRSNQGIYLGAIFSIIKRWYDLGCPKTKESRHDFRNWTQSLDWIVQNIFGLKPLMEGHKETQQRVINPHLNWLRDIGNSIIRSSREGIWFRASELVDVLDEQGIELPGMSESDSLVDEQVRKKVQTAFGRRMGICFKQAISVSDGIDEIILDNLRIQRRITKESRGGISGPQDVKEYRFSPISSPQPAFNEDSTASNASISRDNINELVDISYNNKESLYSSCEGVKGDSGGNSLSKISITINRDLTFNDPSEGLFTIPAGELGYLVTDIDLQEDKRLRELRNEGKNSCIAILKGKRRVIEESDFTIN